ncbi:hypothetical protein KC345_g11804, partial [Hortaea werneckii]
MSQSAAGMEQQTAVSSASHESTASQSLASPEDAEFPDEAALSAFTAQLSTLKARSGEMRREAADWQRSVQELEQLYHKEAAGAEAEQTWVQGLAAKAEELAAAANRLQQEWNGLFPDLAPEEAGKAYQEMLEKDERAEEIRGRLEISVKFLDEKSLAVQTLQEQLAGLDKELAQWDAQLEGKEALERDKEQRLKEWTGGRPAAELLAECERRLKELQTALERSRQGHRQAADKAQQQLQEAAVARQAAESAHEHYMAATSQWEESLQSSPFASAAEVEAASLATGERTQAAGRVRAHREEEAECALQLRSIEEKLGGAVLSSEEWQESQELLLRSREEDESSLQARARAERDLEDLQQR